MQDSQIAVAVIGTLFFSLVIILICREITCWYFKINELSRKLDTTNKTLADIRDLLAHSAAASVAPSAPPAENIIYPPLREHIAGISPKWPIKK